MAICTCTISTITSIPPVDGGHTFSHEIHSLRFGPQLDDAVSWTDHHHSNPLDAVKMETNEAAYNYMYFLKVVSTSYLPLGWDEERSRLQHSGLTFHRAVGEVRCWRWFSGARSRRTNTL